MMKTGLIAIAAGALLLGGCASQVPTDSGCCTTPKCAPCPSCKGMSCCKSTCPPCNNGACGNGNSCRGG